MAEELSLLELLTMDEQLAKKGGSRVKRAFPIPEAVDTKRSWTVKPTQRLGAVDIPAAEMYVPIGDNPADLRVRAHEMSHVAITPNIEAGKEAKKAGITVELLQGLEDARIHGMWKRDKDLSEIGSTPIVSKKELETIRRNLMMKLLGAKLSGQTREAKEIVASVWLASANTPEGEAGVFDELVEWAGLDPKELQEVADKLPDMTFPQMIKEAKRLTKLWEKRIKLPKKGGGDGDAKGGKDGKGKPSPSGKPGKTGKPGGKPSSSSSSAASASSVPGTPSGGGGPKPPAGPPPTKEERKQQAEQLKKLVQEAKKEVAPASYNTKPKEIKLPPAESRAMPSVSNAEQTLADRTRIHLENLMGGLADVKGLIWGELTIETPPLQQVKRSRQRRAQRIKLASDRGGYPGQLHRMRTDGKVLIRKRVQKSRKRTGSLLIDCSGSMSPNPEQIEDVLKQAPFAWIGLYNGGVGFGWLRILAKKNKVVRDLGEQIESFCRRAGSNVVDLPALQELAKQPKPRIWVSDGCVTKVPDKNSGECFVKEGVQEVLAFCDRNQIMRVDLIEMVSAKLTPQQMHEIMKGDRDIYSVLYDDE